MFGWLSATEASFLDNSHASSGQACRVAERGVALLHMDICSLYCMMVHVTCDKFNYHLLA